MPATAFPNGPRATGAAAKLWTAYRFLTDSIGVVGGRFDRYGDVYYVPGKPHGLFVLRHPDHIYQVLVERATSFDKQHGALERLGRVLGKGLLTSDGDEWRRHRRMIQPAFQHARLVTYADVMRDESEALARRWQDGAQVEMGQEMMALTLSIVCRTLFSHDAGKDTLDVARAMSDLQDSATRPDLLPSYLPSPARRRLARANASLDAIIYRLIDERKGQPPTRDDLLDRLLAANDENGKGLTREEIRDELVTLFLAGHETTAQALTWTFYLLSQHPAAEARLHDELERVLGGRAAAFSDLENLKYTEQVIDESMRLYPPVYVVARRAREDVEIGRHHVPRGSELVTWIYWTHRDPRWYENPRAFEPERWTDTMRAGLRRGAYLPFGAGPRTCIGKAFASIEARIVLAALARRFRAELVPGQAIEPKTRVTLTPKHGVRMILRARH